MKDEVERILIDFSRNIDYPSYLDNCSSCKRKLKKATTQLLSLFEIDEGKALKVMLDASKSFNVDKESEKGISLATALAKTLSTQNIYKGVKK